MQDRAQDAPGLKGRVEIQANDEVGLAGRDVECELRRRLGVCI